MRCRRSRTTSRRVFLTFVLVRLETWFWCQAPGEQVRPSGKAVPFSNQIGGRTWDEMTSRPPDEEPTRGEGQPTARGEPTRLGPEAARQVAHDDRGA